jgi:PAS domain S-box-containing protein
VYQKIRRLKSFQILIALFNYFSEPPPEDRENALLFWRMRIFSTIFLLTVFVGTFSYIPNLIIAINSGQKLSGAIYTLAYLLAAMVFFAKPIPFKVRVWTGLLIFYGVGLASLIFLGPVGSGRMYLFAFALLASLLLGLRAGILALVLNISTYFSIGWFLSTGQLQWPHISVQALENWTTTGYTFFFFNTVITVSTGVLVAALEKNLKKEQSLAIELTRSNINLEQEVAERRLAEKELWDSRERYKALTDNLHVGIYRNTVGSEGQFLEANPAIVEIFGFKNKEEFLNIQVSDLYQNPADREKFNEKMRTIGFVRNEELLLKKKDGSPIICSISAVAVKGKHGKVKNYDGVIEDITELKQLENQLHQAQKMEAIGTLAGGIAHDFNNILSAIMGYTELSKMEAPEGGQLKQNLEEIYNASIRAKDLVNHILAFSRQSGPERKPIRISPVVKEAIKMLRASLPTTIEIRHHIEEDVGTIEADTTQIHQVLMNLCTNAYQAMSDKGGILEIGLSNTHVNASQAFLNPNIRPGHYLKLTISDTGQGMDVQVLKRIYEPYYTTKAKGTGTGLGLAVVHGIVKSFNGTITVKSKPNEGTTFQIFIPRVKKAIKSAPRLREDLQTGDEQILLVDDEQAIVDIGKQMLERLGYTVSTRTCGVEALELFKTQPEKYDLIITDLTMPNMTGEKLARELLKIHSGIPIILCTGFSDQLTKEEAIEIGISEFIMKPIAMNQMAKTIRKALDN